ncbi:MAG: glycosyltransferase family 1 protein, partial [Candidatus Bathyarchaeota archaeon]|nr:glycosyltransferase family 1 protein [Candidatus Bathyarchaeota archaeon]
MARILMISPLIGGLSGVGRHTLSLVRGLGDRGHDVSMISTSNAPYVDVRGLRNPSFVLSAAVKA